MLQFVMYISTWENNFTSSYNKSVRDKPLLLVVHEIFATIYSSWGGNELENQGVHIYIIHSTKDGHKKLFSWG
jgi:hypothetical protein